MNNIILYLRCSTEGQEYAQQIGVIESYIKRNGINSQHTEIVSEKVSGSVRHTERKLFGVIEQLHKQDVENRTIIVSELSRLGRNMADLFSIVSKCTEYKIRLIQAKDGSIIEGESIGGKALLFALSLAAEIELNNIRQRTKAGTDAARQRGVKFGRANDKYNMDETKRSEMAEKVGLAMCFNTLNNPQTICLMKHFRRVVPAFQQASTDEPLFFLQWSVKTARITKDDIREVVRNINEFSRDLYPNGVTESEVKQAYYNKMRTIKRYNELTNKE